MATAVFASGYVLGARAGRERYEEIRRAYVKVAGHPKVRETVDRLEDQALNRYNDNPPRT